ncbi:esterase-like activity of phytase family protein [Thalassobius vesicularis]|uniref:Esterase-like activity of phytase family protein n=1 Tax=Thalassobius vesicularis TaxID=1294297 RepID=A0A4S3MDU8_9RHOB|nr:esterase-like activity of phytase family protein [Thalassobius vesicularis]THD76657.1 esterase-like activity of phytase family protein [Thalassobius vesicularis]
MRQRLAIAVIFLALLVGLADRRPFDPGPALLDRVLDLPRDRSRLGGYSGLHLAEDGAEFVIVSDRGRVLRGSLLREGGHLSGVRAKPILSLRDTRGKPVRGMANDAEGVAVAPDGTLFVSFEGAHQILAYPVGETTGARIETPIFFATLPSNGGLEALAIDPEGRLITIPERSFRRNRATPVYRQDVDGWTELPGYVRSHGFLPVGADVGPDGRLYILERHFAGLGFASRVRSFALGPELSDARLILRTPARRHGNLEGLSVWRDGQGQIRLTMISDDNFLALLPGQIVEYILPKSLANKGATH